MGTGIDIYPFIAVALGQAPGCHKALDRLYQTDMYRYRFYRAAITDKYYRHILITEGNLLEVEYTRKALGILTFLKNCVQEQKKQNENDFVKINETLKKIIQKAYPYAHSYILTQTVFVSEKFFYALVKKYKGRDNLGDLLVNNNIAVALFLAMNQSKEIIEDELLLEFIEYTHTSLHGMEKIVGSKLSLDNATPELLIKINNTETKYADLVKQVQSNIVQQDKTRKKYDFIFDFLDLCFTSITENTKTDKNMFRKLAMAYYITTPAEEVSEDSLRAYIVPAALIYRMGQAYNDAKEYYFANNKEIMYAETEALEMDKRKLNIEKRNLEHKNEELSDIIKENYKQIRRLEDKLAAAENNKAELIALREMMFQQSKKNQEGLEQETQIQNYSELKSLKAVFVGGRPAWQKKMKEFLPNAAFIDTNVLNFDTTLLRNTYVYVNTTYISHAMYYRVVENLPTSSTLKFLNHDNIDICLNSLC